MFSHRREQLSELFQWWDDDRHSLEEVKQWGGVEKLMTDLGTSLKVVITKHRLVLKNVLSTCVWACMETTKIALAQLQPSTNAFFYNKMLAVNHFEGIALLFFFLATVVFHPSLWLWTCSLLFIYFAIFCKFKHYLDSQLYTLTKKRVQTTYTCIRDGEQRNVVCWEVMVGDIVMVEQGDRLLMDGVVVSGSPIFEELMISATSRQQKVPIQTNPLEDKQTFVVSGSKVAEGRGKVLVLVVGSQTQMAKSNDQMGVNFYLGSFLYYDNCYVIENNVQRIATRVFLIFLALPLTYKAINWFLTTQTQDYSLITLCLLFMLLAFSTITSVVQFALQLRINRLCTSNIIPHDLTHLSTAYSLTTLVFDTDLLPQYFSLSPSLATLASECQWSMLRQFACLCICLCTQNQFLLSIVADWGYVVEDLKQTVVVVESFLIGDHLAACLIECGESTYTVAMGPVAGMRECSSMLNGDLQWKAVDYTMSDQFEYVVCWSKGDCRESELNILGGIGVELGVGLLPMLIQRCQIMNISVVLMSKYSSEVVRKLGQEINFIHHDDQIMPARKLKEMIDVTGEQNERPNTYILPQNIPTLTQDVRLVSDCSIRDKQILVCALIQMQQVVGVLINHPSHQNISSYADISFSTQTSCKPGIKINDILDVIQCVQKSGDIKVIMQKILEASMCFIMVMVMLMMISHMVLRVDFLNTSQIIWVMMFFNCMSVVGGTSYMRIETGGKGGELITSEQWKSIFSHTITQLIIICIIIVKNKRLIYMGSIHSQEEKVFMQGYFSTLIMNMLCLMQVFNYARMMGFDQPTFPAWPPHQRQLLSLFFYTFPLLVCHYLLVEAGWGVLGTTGLTLQDHFYCVLLSSVVSWGGSIFQSLIPDQLAESVDVEEYFEFEDEQLQ